MPTSLFNGIPKARILNDGPDRSYRQFRSIIDPLLEENATVAVTAKAERRGDKIEVQLAVSGLADPSTDKKLRIMLAEETVRYQRYESSSIRLHCHVVRACIGGADGIPLTKADSNHNLTVNLDKLRGQLTKYFDDTRSTYRGSNVRVPPVALEHLRVIAFVQDDNTREILQAVQAEVK